ncbi:hypothetical protein DH2020_029569 [Rehmannia glutinosa]|uniref:NmrA-like domain-containing protein n=1 Tax=Rehmannia glutinosa TaxID=99300 RepID=A0ABR0VQY8_REHGL
MAGKSKILVIGGTGYIGKFIVEASANAGHPTFILVRESTLCNTASPKSNLIQSFRSSSVNFILGDLYDHESLVKAIKQVDVVISTVGYAQLNDQDKIVAAIKEAGNVKRFFPSEFGNDVDRVHAVEPAKSTFGHKAQFRRLVEAAGVPYTYVSSNFFAGIFVRTLAQLDAIAPPRDKVVILGDGNTKEASVPLNVRLAICHSVFVMGDHTNFEIEPSFGVEASELYPDVKYATVDEMLDQYRTNPRGSTQTQNGKKQEQGLEPQSELEIQEPTWIKGGQQVISH